MGIREPGVEGCDTTLGTKPDDQQGNRNQGGSVRDEAGHAPHLAEKEGVPSAQLTRGRARRVHHHAPEESEGDPDGQEHEVLVARFQGPTIPEERHQESR